MTLKLSELLDKAKQKGIQAQDKPTTSKNLSHKPWYTESILNKSNTNPTNINNNSVVNKEISNGNQTVNKEISNGNQTVNKEISNGNQTVNKEISNGNQTVNKEISNGNQTVNKEISNGNQTVNKEISNGNQTVNKEISNGDQTVNKEISNGNQTVNKEISNGNQTVNKEISNGDQTVNKEISNGNQTVNKEISNGDQNSSEMVYIDDFTGLQKELLLYLRNKIINVQNKVTSVTTINDIIQSIGGDSGLIKQAIYRCKSKNVLSIEKRKDGRGGWCQYRLAKRLNFDSKIGDQTVINRQNKSPLYNNNDYYYKNKGGDQNIPNSVLPKVSLEDDSNNQQIESPDNSEMIQTDPWLQIDYSELEPYFKKINITQLRKVEDLTPEIVQVSINHFAWMRENDPERKSKFSPESNPIRGLIGSLKKGNPWVEPGYIDPKVKAFDDLNAFKRKRLEEIRKRKEEAFNLDFEIWLEETDRKIIAEIESKQGVKGKTLNDSRYRGMMKDYFKNHHYQTDK